MPFLHFLYSQILKSHFLHLPSCWRESLMFPFQEEYQLYRCPTPECGVDLLELFNIVFILFLPKLYYPKGTPVKELVLGLLPFLWQFKTYHLMPQWKLLKLFELHLPGLRIGEKFMEFLVFGLLHWLLRCRPNELFERSEPVQKGPSL